mmetsp:Transcript_31927/g.45408  ORF Transcript_31927/g.45408 Transcript_31927/m.45408 type:complete len:164 (+) Transcript_31927:45-536(+)
MKWFIVGASLILAKQARSFAPSIQNKFHSSFSLFASTETRPLGKPGTAELDTPWEELGFEFRPTNSHVRLICKDGEWGKPELVKDSYINLHIGATALHYGQSCFEGLKAFTHEDGSVNIFRPDENAKRCVLASLCLPCSPIITIPRVPYNEYSLECNHLVSAL